MVGHPYGKTLRLLEVQNLQKKGKSKKAFEDIMKTLFGVILSATSNSLWAFVEGTDVCHVAQGCVHKGGACVCIVLSASIQETGTKKLKTLMRQILNFTSRAT